jgi:hypothetical protein
MNLKNKKNVINKKVKVRSLDQYLFLYLKKLITYIYKKINDI